MKTPKQAPRVYPLKSQTLCYSLGLLVSANQHQEIENHSSTISLVFYTEMMDVCYSFIQRWWMCVSHIIKKKNSFEYYLYVPKNHTTSENQHFYPPIKFSKVDKNIVIITRNDGDKICCFYLFTVFFIRDSKCNSLSNVRMR